MKKVTLSEIAREAKGKIAENNQGNLNFSKSPCLSKDLRHGDFFAFAIENSWAIAYISCGG